MEAVMIKLLNMSITAIWLILAVVLLRAVLKKAPKFINLILWALVGLRLVCPFSFESIMSIIPSAEPIPGNIQYSASPSVDTGINTVNEIVNPAISNFAQKPFTTGINPIETVLLIGFCLWIWGIAVMLIYSAVSFMSLHKKVKISVRYEDNIYLCDNIKTPFILGIFRPKIYLPSDITEQQINSVIAHEKAHIKRFDHIWKPLGFAALSVHWFNPFVWLAYSLLCRDIEYACDEKVIKEMKTEEKMIYSEALLSLSIPKRSLAACPLAFGEVGVKSRIKSVLSYKKPALWIIVVAVIALIAVAVGFMTNPANQSVDGYHYIDKYYYQHVIGEDRANNEMRDTKYRIDPEMTVVMMNDSGTTTLGTLGKLVDMNEHELELIFDKLPITYTRNSAKDIYEVYVDRSNKHIFIMFKNGDFIGANLHLGGDGDYYVMEAFKLKRDPDITVEPISEFSDFYIEGTTTNENVTIGIIEMDLSSSPYIIAKWDNNTGDTLTYGAAYGVYRHENGEKIDCDILEQRLWYTLLYMSKGNTDTRKFSLMGYDISKPGTYSVEFNFGVESDEEAEYTAVLEFQIEEGVTGNVVPTSDPSVQPSTPDSIVSENTTTSIAVDTLENLNPYFDAKVLEVNKKNILVEPLEGEDEPSRIYVSTDVISVIAVPEMKKGDVVRIVYNGEIQETFPAGITKVFAIYLQDN